MQKQYFPYSTEMFMQFSLLLLFSSLATEGSMNHKTSRFKCVSITIFYKLNTDTLCGRLLSMSHICFKLMCIYFDICLCALSRICQAPTYWRQMSFASLNEYGILFAKDAYICIRSRETYLPQKYITSTKNTQSGNRQNIREKWFVDTCVCLTYIK